MRTKPWKIAVDNNPNPNDIYITPRLAKELMDTDPTVVVLDFPFNESVQNINGQKYISRVDNRFNRLYKDAHIPNSVKACVFDFEERDTGNIKDAEKIKEFFLSKGINCDTHLIVYSDLVVVAAYAAFIAYWVGVKQVRIIDGGIQCWNDNNYPLTRNVSIIKPLNDFGIDVPARPEILLLRPEDVHVEQMLDSNYLCASIRSWDEFIGKETGYSFVTYKGEPAHSVFTRASDKSTDIAFLTNDKEEILVDPAILEEWASWGVTPSKHVSFHCGGGYRAAAVYFITLQLGWKHTCVYQGGSGQWNKYHLNNPKEYPIQKGDPLTQSSVLIDYI